MPLWNCIALAQLERVGQMVRRFRHRCGQFEDRVVVLVARHQRFEDVHRDVARGDRRRRHLVEAVDVGFLAEHEIAADMGALEGGRVGRRRERQAGQQTDRCQKPSCHRHLPPLSVPGAEARSLRMRALAVKSAAPSRTWQRIEKRRGDALVPRHAPLAAIVRSGRAAQDRGLSKLRSQLRLCVRPRSRLNEWRIPALDCRRPRRIATNPSFPRPKSRR